MKLIITEIQGILLHRYPFLLSDSIEEVVPEEHAVAKKDVTVNEQVFQSYSPENPVLPGVLVVESLAQTGTVVLLPMPELKGKTTYFGRSDRAKFGQKVTPSDTLISEVELSKIRAPAEMSKGVAKVNGGKAAGAELTFMIG